MISARLQTFFTAFLLATAIAAPAQILRTLVNFDFTNGGDPEYTTLVQGLNGNMYGTTVVGGGTPNAYGTFFDITPQGALTTIYDFGTQANSGAAPEAGVMLAGDANFYGTTLYGATDGGMGTVFKITPSGKLTTLHYFCTKTCQDGASPYGGLIEASNGTLFGTTSGEGTSSHGTVFKITVVGQLSTIHTFNGADGASPYAGLIQASNGNLYGTTSAGGDLSCNQGFGCGTVFRITREGKFKVLHTFEGTDGFDPFGVLVQASDGNLYGTTVGGGTDCSGGCGTVFRVTPNGTFTTVHAFNFTDGSQPSAGLVQATDGDLYGTTTAGGNLSCSSQVFNGCGVVFRIALDGTFSIMHEFDGTDGANPWGALAQATSGVFFGTTMGHSWGTVFSLDVGLGPFAGLVTDFGKVGQTSGILGQGLTGTTNVYFNGVPANFTVRADTFLTAIVPSGATTGYVTVTTPSGTLTSNVPFRVIP